MRRKASPEVLKSLLEQCRLLDRARAVNDSTYSIQWGSVTIVTGSSGGGIVVVAPMFDAPPKRRREAFCHRLLELNSEMGGTAAFAVQPGGSVVLQVGRGIKGINADEFGIMIGTVARFAQDYTARLREEFYGSYSGAQPK